MKPFRTVFTTIAFAAVFAATASVHADDTRIDIEQLQPWGVIENLAWPLQVAAAPECRDPSYRTGFEVLASPVQGMFVRSIADGAPADGRLQLEDRIVALNDRDFPSDGIQAYEQWVTGLRDEVAASDQPQRWTVERNGERLDVELYPVSVCHLDILYVAGNGPSLLRRENTLVFTPQLHELAPEPWMVQAQVAHDLGHRLGQHEQKAQRTSRWAARVLREAHGTLCRAFGQRTTGTIATTSTGELLDALDAVLAAVDKADRNMWTDTEVLRDAHNTLCRAYRQRAAETPPAAGSTGGLLEVARGQIEKGMRELDALADLDEQQALTVASARSSLGRATAALAAAQTSKPDIGQPPATREACGASSLDAMGELRWLESWIRKVAPTGSEAAHESVRKHIHEARGEIDSVTGWDDLQSDALGCAENALQRALRALAQERDPVHARWELVAHAFDTSTTGRSERILQDLGLPDDEAWKPFEWHVDQALAKQQPQKPAQRRPVLS